MNNLSYFEIQASNPKKTIAFYKNVFAWRFTAVKNLPIEYYTIDGAGINGALLARPAKTPPTECGTNAFCYSFMVENFDKTAKKIMSNGGLVALPKFALPGKCWQGYFLDNDNNVFGIFEVDKNAK